MLPPVLHPTRCYQLARRLAFVGVLAVVGSPILFSLFGDLKPSANSNIKIYECSSIMISTISQRQFLLTLAGQC